MSTHDFPTLYTILPHNLIKGISFDLTERTFQRKGTLYLECNDRNAFLTPEEHKRYILWFAKSYVKLSTFFWIIFILDLILSVGIPMGINCAPLVADLFLFLFCYERDSMLSLFGDKEAEIFEAFSSTSKPLDDLLNIDNIYFTAWSIRFTHQNFNKIKLIHPIPRPRFWIYI